MDNIIFNSENKVTLIDTAGGDKSHCLSAWCSTFEDLGLTLPDKVENRIDYMFSEIVKTKKKTPQELLNMLFDNVHGTPFEKSYIHYQIETDISSHIHLLKHRVAVSVNSASARYKRFKNYKVHLPDDWPDEEKEKHQQFFVTCVENYERSFKSLLKHYEESGMVRSDAIKRAKETARYYLPYSNKIVCDVSFNWRSFYHFLGLRYSVHSQKEIRDIAEKCLREIVDLRFDDFKYTLRAYRLLDENNEIVKPFKKHFVVVE